MKKFLVAVNLLFATIGFSQSIDNGFYASDAANPILLPLEKSLYYKCAFLPDGPGAAQDIQNADGKLKSMSSREHHSAWYVFECNLEGDIGMDLIPLKNTDDLDFAFFKYDGSKDFYKKIQAGNEQPVVANSAKNDLALGGVTGMKLTSKQTLVGIGVGNQFCKSIHVYKGEKYYLYIDNNSDNGSGFKLYLYYQKLVTIAGKVTADNTSSGIPAEVSVQNDQTGVMVETVKTDANGNFNFDVPFNPAVNYHIYYYNDDYLFRASTIAADDILNNKVGNLDVVMPKLEIGKIYRLDNINFVGDATIVVTNSYASMKALALLMKMNKDMKIRICGYVNGCERGQAYAQNLSERRAVVIYDYLKSVKVSADRISHIGFGCQNMIYPKPQSEYEHEQNRRVEIQVLSK